MTKRPPNPFAKRPSKAEKRRAAIRDTHWPDAANKVWSRKENDGYTTIPRLLSLVCALIRQIASDDPTRVYVDLWCHVWDQGIVDSPNEDDCAYSSGYVGTRARRTWTKHIWELEKLGFIKVAKDGNREIGHILIVNPLIVCAELHAKGKAPDEWWAAFVRRAGEIGAKLPGDSDEKE